MNTPGHFSFNTTPASEIGPNRRCAANALWALQCCREMRLAPRVVRWNYPARTRVTLEGLAVLAMLLGLALWGLFL